MNKSILVQTGMDGDFITSPCASCCQYSCKADIVKSLKQNKNYKTTTYVIGNECVQYWILHQMIESMPEMDTTYFPN